MARSRVAFGRLSKKVLGIPLNLVAVFAVRREPLKKLMGITRINRKDCPRSSCYSDINKHGRTMVRYECCREPSLDLVTLNWNVFQVPIAIFLQ